MASIVKRKSKYSWCMITQMKTENADSVGKPSAQMQKQKKRKKQIEYEQDSGPSLFLRQDPERSAR